MSNFLKDNDDDADVKAIAIPRVFSENSRARNGCGSNNGFVSKSIENSVGKGINTGNLKMESFSYRFNCSLSFTYELKHYINFS